MPAELIGPLSGHGYAIHPGPSAAGCRRRKGDPGLGRVRLRGGGVATATGQFPGQQSWFGLVEPPAGCLLGLVMSAAQRIQIAFAGLAVLMVRNRVVVVGTGGGA